MALPLVNINFTNGAIGTIAPMDDGCAALVCHAKGCSAITLYAPFFITSLQDLGLDPDDPNIDPNNLVIYNMVADFYREAPNGTHLWILGIEPDDYNVASGSSTPSSGTDNPFECEPEGTVCNLLRQAQGEIRLLMVQSMELDAFSGDVPAYVDALHQLCSWATDTLYAPCLAITNCDDIDSSDIPALCDMGCNRVAAVDAVHGGISALGLVGGRLAAYPVHHNLARVKNGPIKQQGLMVGMDNATLDPESCTDLDNLHDNAWITPRTFIGLAGQYWNDDRLCTSVEDDYAYITRRRTIDKAYRIAYQTLVTELGDHVPVNDDGTPVAAYCKAIETKVETAIANRMTAFGNLGTDPNDPNDLGVQCLVDNSGNILQSSTLAVTLRVKPYGYARYIDVQLGFLVNND